MIPELSHVPFVVIVKVELISVINQIQTKELRCHLWMHRDGQGTLLLLGERSHCPGQSSPFQLSPKAQAQWLNVQIVCFLEKLLDSPRYLNMVTELSYFPTVIYYKIVLNQAILTVKQPDSFNSG